MTPDQPATAALTTPDYEKAALKAMDTIIQRRISSAPVSPMPILKSIPGVLVVSYAEMAVRAGLAREHIVTLFGEHNQDAVTSVKIGEDGKRRYFVVYNQRLPFYMLQRSLARELGHIVLGHDGSRPESVRQEEALTFARHLLCPRPLIHALQSSGVKLTVEVFGNITGCYERCLAGIRKTPGVNVPAMLNRIVGAQFEEYVTNFLDFQRAVADEDETPEVDFGTYMDGYKE